MNRAALMAAAEAAHDAGDLDGALEIYERLEAHDSSDPTWPSRVAEICRAKKDRPGRVHALCRAARAFAVSGVPMKGVAMAKLAHALDKNNPETKALLDALSRGELPMAKPSEVETEDVDDLGDDLQISVLPPIALFSRIGPEAFSRLLETGTLHDLEPGDIVFRKGDVAESMYVIAEGAVDVILEEGQPPVARLKGGDFFGEMALFAKSKTGNRRGAEIVVVEQTQLLELRLEVLTDLIKADPNILSVVLRVFGERLIENVLRSAPLFQELKVEERSALGKRFRPTNVSKGELLIQQGAAASALYILIHGELEVIRKKIGVDAEVIAELGSGALFGEISVLTGLPATATVLAKKKCLLLTLPAADFHSVAQAHPALFAHAAKLAGQRLE